MIPIKYTFRPAFGERGLLHEDTIANLKDALKDREEQYQLLQRRAQLCSDRLMEATRTIEKLEARIERLEKHDDQR